MEMYLRWFAGLDYTFEEFMQQRCSSAMGFFGIGSVFLEG
jgi:hypothetical protein